MKFRLKTMFALTAVAGVWFFLARLNPWLPVLPLVMFGPAVAFLRRPTLILFVSLAMPLAWSSERGPLQHEPVAIKSAEDPL